MLHGVRFNSLIGFSIAIFCACPQVFAQNGADFDPRCPTRDHKLLRDEQIQPQGLAEFLNGHAGELKTVDDMICCLPKSYRRSFVIIHSSVSAQSSDIHGPRVIMYGKKKAKRGAWPKLQTAISFNGGSENLSNPKNLEIIHNGQEAELYEISWEQGKPSMSGKNPELCLSCHGERGQLATGGPKTIFEDVDQWTRAVQGIHVAEAEEPLARAIERAAQKTFERNTRYRCLDQDIAREHHFSGDKTSTAPELQEIDELLTRMNDRRLAKLIRETRDYEKFKYAIVGSLGCFKFENCGRDGLDIAQPNGCHADFSKWIPQSVLARMTDTSFVDSRLRRSSNLRETVREIFKKSFIEQLSTIEKQPDTIKALDQGLNPYIEIYRGPLSPPNGVYELERRERNLDAKLAGRSPLDFYKADSEIRSVRGALFNPFFQYIFEARGIDIGGFSMDPIPDSYTRSPSAFLVNELMKLEREGSGLRALKAQLIDAQLMAPDRMTSYHRKDDKTLLKARTLVCNSLQLLSYSTAGANL